MAVAKKPRKVNKSKQPPKPTTDPSVVLVCGACGEQKKQIDMFKSYNPIHKNGFLPYCKSCFKEMCNDNRGKMNSENVKKALQLVDRPFIVELYKNVVTKGLDIGSYMKDLGLPQYRDWTYKNSVFETNNVSLEDECYDGISEEVLNRWKEYSEEDVISLEEFYQSMKADNRIETVQDEVYLKKLAVINLEQDKAGRRGEWSTYDKLGSMFSKFMADAKLRKSDQSEADRSGGLRNFGAIYAEVEKDDFIPPWSYYAKINGANQDIVDKTIMHIENFTRRVNKVERMIVPPIDTPKMQDEEIDWDAKISEFNTVIEDDLLTEEEGE